MRNVTAHLTEAEFALYTDAIILNTLDRLPDAIQDHVMECTDCKKELMELLNVYEAEKAGAKRNDVERGKPRSL
ncbi:MAG: hypothetical protein WBZ48_10725 [Bacteroidota bacterium]